MLFSLIKESLSGNTNIYTLIPTALMYIFSSLIVIFLTLPIHEFAHGFVATKLGDPTPRYQGRLTLNPFAHIDWIGAVCILVFGFGWAKPVQVNARYFKNSKWGMAVTALAGPFSNIIVAFICILLRNIILFSIFKITGTTEHDFIEWLNIFYYIAQINVSLAVFNFIPIPPLDGSRIVSVFLPTKVYFKIMRYERYLIWAVFILIYIGALDTPLYLATNGVLSGLTKIASLPFNLFV